MTSLSRMGSGGAAAQPDAGLVDGQLESLPALKVGIDKPPVPTRAQVYDSE